MVHGRDGLTLTDADICGAQTDPKRAAVNAISERGVGSVRDTT